MSGDRPFVPRGRLRASGYRLLLRSAQAFYKAGNGCLFIAAGLLRRDELQSASVEQYRVFNLSAAEVDAGLTPAEKDFYSRFVRQGDRVLLVGSGTGRDLMALRVLGYDVSGLEPEPALVEIAARHLTRRGLSAPMEIGLVHRAHLNGPYDCVIFSNGCYSLIQGTATRIAVLERIAQHLSPRGRVIVSYHPGRAQSAFGHFLSRMAARVARADWRPEAGDTFARDVYTPDLIRYHHAFAPAEFAHECASAGLRVLSDEKYSEGYFFAAAERRTA
jgi:2-polyprenyl-3-methyl-5-hydroxy-6-metoxy-1,4-benzoquinol methylase